MIQHPNRDNNNINYIETDLFTKALCIILAGDLVMEELSTCCCHYQLPLSEPNSSNNSGGFS